MNELAQPDFMPGQGHESGDYCSNSRDMILQAGKAVSTLGGLYEKALELRKKYVEPPQSVLNELRTRPDAAAAANALIEAVDVLVPTEMLDDEDPGLVAEVLEAALLLVEDSMDGGRARKMSPGVDPVAYYDGAPGDDLRDGPRGDRYADWGVNGPNQVGRLLDGEVSPTHRGTPSAQLPLVGSNRFVGVDGYYGEKREKGLID